MTSGVWGCPPGIKVPQDWGIQGVGQRFLRIMLLHVLSILATLLTPHFLGIGGIMRISRNKLATFDYTVMDERGELIDTSLEFGPLSYVHGKGKLVPGLESALDGKSPSDSFSVTLAPAQGYGERNNNLVHVFTKKELSRLNNLNVGMQLQAHDSKGQRLMTVTKIEGDNVTLDENHPLAGKTITFDITVLDVHDATPDELYGEQAFTTSCHDSCQDSCQSHMHGTDNHGCGCGCDHHH